ncbi:MAG: hypothetical protein J6T39_00940, partial [Clostridia bacterium]|nr:hypothetical protein [Clostridia bacterium]
DLYIKLTKTDNNISTTNTSNKFMYEIVPYVITGITINDGGNNTLVVPQNSPRPLSVAIDVESKVFADEATRTKSAKQLTTEYIESIESAYSLVIENSEIENKSQFKLNFYEKMLNMLKKSTKSTNFDVYYAAGGALAEFTTLKTVVSSATISANFDKYQIAINVLYLQEKIAQTCGYWYGNANGLASFTKLFESQTAFGAYAVSKNSNNMVTISVKQIDTTASLYVELPISMTSNMDSDGTDELVNEVFDFVQNDYTSTRIGDYSVGIVQHTANYFSQYLRDNVVMNLSSDVSQEYPTPITTAQEFLNMKSGVNGETMFYALNSDIVLENYRPINLSGISLDGNEHIISIKNFKPVDTASEDKKFLTEYALFDTIDDGSIVKNLNVNIEGLVLDNDEEYRSYAAVATSNGDTLQEINTTGFDISTFNFGAVCSTNNGVIYNVKTMSKSITYTVQPTFIDGNYYRAVKEYPNGTKYIERPNGSGTTRYDLDGTAIIYDITTITLGSDQTLRFVNDTANTVLVAGFVATNSGFITNSTSSMNISANCGSVAGFVAVNSKKISACKTVVCGKIENTLTTSENSLTAGFVTKNTGSIYSSFVSGIYSNQHSNEKLLVESRASLGGFVNNNSGTIKNCYTNIMLGTTSRSGGFVYENSGTILSSFTNNLVASSSSAHMPFVATNSAGNYLDEGEIDDCYYIDEDNEVNKIYTLIVEHPSVKEITKTKAKNKASFAKFIFNTGSDDLYANVWKMGSNYPTLVDANLVFYSQQKYYGLATSSDGASSYYSWIFVDNTPEYGKSVGGVSGKVNPRIINSAESWNKIITKENSTDFVVVVRDLSMTAETPLTAKVDFGGVLFGNNMEIKNLYLRANSVQTRKNFGLFASLNSAQLKNLIILPKDVISNNANNVGTLAGYILKSKVSDVQVDATDIVIQGRNMVGVFAGLINSSKITGVDVMGSVNAGFRDSTTELKNFVNDDLEILVNDDVVFARVETKQSGKTYYYIDYPNFNDSKELYYGEPDGNGSATNTVKIVNNKYLYLNNTYIKKSDGKFEKVNIKVYPQNDSSVVASVLYETAYIPYSYSGVFAGAVIGTQGNSTITNINVTGQNKVVGYYAGSLTGLVGENTTVKLARAIVEAGTNNTNVNYVRAYGISGGLVGENRGTIERSYIQHEETVQQQIDGNTTNNYLTNRNMTFFAGSPKFAGGLVGFNNGGTIKWSYSKVDVRTNNYITKSTGGLVGLDVGGDIEYCYATGSVINRFIIGGLIGVVTNKETLLGQTIKNEGGNDVIERNDYEYIFATNYEYKDSSNGKTLGRDLRKRSAFIAGKIADIDDSSTNLLTLKYNLASNKWLLAKDSSSGMTDISMIYNAVSGFVIGSVVDNGAKARKNVTTASNKGHITSIVLSRLFSSTMRQSSSEQQFNLSATKNYINTQVLKGRVVTTMKTITLSDILKSFIEMIIMNGDEMIDADVYYSQVDSSGNKARLLTAIENASIGGYSEIISLATIAEDKPIPQTRLASSTLNSALVSFENILNVDDILLGNGGQSDGLFKSYNTSTKTYFILPNRTESRTRYYPEIIVNINI